MVDEVLVSVQGASKKFCRSLKRSLWYGLQDVGSEFLGRAGHQGELRANEFWAVDDVSFELKRGDCLGLIGPNGAGKSTLLKMLNGLIKPDRGRIVMRGRVGALIELGAGFNPILTARENIFVNGSVLGLSQKEIRSRLDSIVAFAEVEEFLDTPVRNFSSGMQVRLGFAIASQMEPDVLLVDEVLAVGDANFALKCINRINRISRECAVIIVTHSMPMVSRMSSVALSLDRGKTSYYGRNVGAAIEDYFLKVELTGERDEISECLELVECLLNGQRSESVAKSNLVRFDCPFSLEVRFRASRPLPSCYANVVFMDMEGKAVAQCLSSNSDFRFIVERGEFAIKLDLPSLYLNPGRYFIHLGIVEALPGSQLGQILYQNRLLASLSVQGGMLNWAPVQFAASWKLLA